eukprot:COSAG03_NODE_2842_length_2412_cov_2530.501513_3_plen_123_part_00
MSSATSLMRAASCRAASTRCAVVAPLAFPVAFPVAFRLRFVVVFRFPVAFAVAFPVAFPVAFRLRFVVAFACGSSYDGSSSSEDLPQFLTLVLVPRLLMFSSFWALFDGIFMIGSSQLFLFS